MNSSGLGANIPIAEILHDPVAVTELWPTHQAEPSFSGQIEAHTRNSDAVVALVNSLKGTGDSAEQSVDQEQLRLGYTALASMIDSPDSARLLLYVPFELLPRKPARTTNKGLATSQHDFMDAYRQTWLGLLSEHDVRANFVDGDVLEPEYRSSDLLRVVKAAHFVPTLLRRGIINQPEISAILASANPLLEESLTEGLKAYRGDAKELVIGNREAITSPRRRAWLERRELEEKIRAFAVDSQPYLRQARPGLEDLMSLGDGSPFRTQATAEAVYQYVHQSANGRDEAIKYEPLFGNLTASEDPALRNRATSIYRRLFHLGYYTAELLTSRGVSIPTLEGPLSRNLAKMSQDIQKLQQKAQHLEATPDLLEYFYPIFTVGGSRLKGYGQADSDVDVCMFVKPKVPESSQRKIQELATRIAHPYEPALFWLEAAGESLSVRDTTYPNAQTADKYWTHVLFGSAWTGSNEAVRDIQQRLLPTYFSTPDEQDRKWNSERIEQDLLQYRLMHKGYGLHYPAVQPEEPLRSPWVDGQSTFWDPGYRQLATKLFARYVFIPRSL